MWALGAASPQGESSSSSGSTQIKVLTLTLTLTQIKVLTLTLTLTKIKVLTLTLTLHHFHENSSEGFCSILRMQRDPCAPRKRNPLSFQFAFSYMFCPSTPQKIYDIGNMYPWVASIKYHICRQLPYYIIIVDIQYISLGAGGTWKGASV